MLQEITGGEAIARMIQAFEGGPMFGMGGFQLLPFYDAARRLGLSHHLINDERAGSSPRTLTPRCPAASGWSMRPSVRAPPIW